MSNKKAEPIKPEVEVPPQPLESSEEKKEEVKLKPKKIPIFLFILIGIIVIALLAILILKKTEYTRDQKYLSVLQDQVSIAAYIKAVGDSLLVSNKPVPTGWNMKKVKSTDVDAQDKLLGVYSSVKGTKLVKY